MKDDKSKSSNQNNDELTPIQKGYNWTALVGQVIKGNLIRGAGGKFANKSELAKIQDKIKQRIMAILKKAMERKAKAEKKKADAAARAAAKKSKVAARKKAKGDAKKAKDKNTQKNQQDTFKRLAESGQISIDELNALASIRNGGEIDPKVSRSLAQKGLVEIGEDGKVTATSKARTLLNAANKEDSRDYRIIIPHFTVKYSAFTSSKFS